MTKQRVVKIAVRITRTAGLLGASLLITSCAGGGGGGGSTGGGGTSFTSWSAVGPNSTIIVPGYSRQVNFTQDVGTGKITSVGTITGFSSGASFTGTYNSAGDLTALSINPAGGTTVSFSTDSGDIIGTLPFNSQITVAGDQQGTKAAFAADPFQLGWNYQSFGIWTTVGMSSLTAGVMTVGALTAAGSVPMTGTGSYTGAAGGFYVDASGDSFFTTADMSAVADFTNQSISFSTNNTQMTSDLITSQPNPTLNLAGTLTYSAGSNQFSGNVITTGNLSGSADGVFYGPSAQEIGGIFSVSNSGIETYAGGFGGKQ